MYLSQCKNIIGNNEFLTYFHIDTTQTHKMSFKSKNKNTYPMQKKKVTNASVHVFDFHAFVT